MSEGGLHSSEDESDYWSDEPPISSTSGSIRERARPTLNEILSRIEKRRLSRMPTIHSLKLQGEESRKRKIEAAPENNTFIENGYNIRSESAHEIESLIPAQSTSKEHAAKYKGIGLEIEKLKDDIEELQKKSDANELTVQELPLDHYSFIVVKPYSIATVIVLALTGVQLIVYFLAVSDSFERDEDDLKQKAPLNAPKGISPLMILAQAIAIFLVLLVQSSFLEAIQYLHLGYRKQVEDLDIVEKDRKFVWLISNILRLMENIAAICVIFTLIVKSENIIDLLKDFTAMTFISDLDDNVFKLAEDNFLGAAFRQITSDVKDFRYYSTKPSYGKERESSRNRSIYLVAFLLGLYSIWFSMFLNPSVNNQLVCQRIFIQMDDIYNTDLGYFTGHYRIDQKSRYNRFFASGRFVAAYTEERFDNKDWNKWNPLGLRYCSDQMYWVIGPAYDNYDDECKEENILVKTKIALDDLGFDVFALPEDHWLARSKDGRTNPINVYMTCQDEDNVEELFSEDEKCDRIELFDDTNKLTTNREWSHEFEIIKFENGTDLRIYERPVYFETNIDTDEDRVIDIVFFTGLRWIILSTTYLKDFTPSNEEDIQKIKKELINYLNDEYHANHSVYEIAFFSEPVIQNSLLNKLSPVDLVLLRPHNKQKIQLRDYDAKVPNKFICSICNNSINPCHHEGTCENQKCKCQYGTSGTLCQKKPIGNGFCDKYFNKFKFGFDGGDCCAHTCVSSDHICGRDKTGGFFIGFDDCRVNDDDRIGTFIKSKAALEIGGQNIDISLSSSGNVLAVHEYGTKIVRVFDSEGSMWILRDQFIRRVDDLEFGRIIRVSSEDDIFKSKNSTVLVPVTVAVMGTSTLYIYDWQQSFLKWNEQIVPDVGGDEVSTFELRNNGKLLILLKKNGQIMSFQRNGHHEQFESITVPSMHKFDHISVSNNGEMLLAADKSCVCVYSVKLLEEEYKECSSKSTHEIFNIQISPSGKAFGFTVSHRDRWDIFIVKRRNGEWGKSRWQSRKDQGLLTINDSGNVTFRDEWTSLEGHLKMYVSSDQKHAIVHESTTGKIDSTLRTYTAGEFCNKDEYTIYFTFALDYSPNELSWEIIQFDTTETIKILHGDSYNSTLTISKEVCVSTQECIAVRIIDYGMDGLNSPGYLGVAFNGTIIFNKTIANGYSNLYPIFGGENCREKTNEDLPWKKYNISMHKYCLSSPCRWGTIGMPIEGLFYDERAELGVPSPISLSADGFILAIGDFSYNNDVGQVNLFKFDGNQSDWLSLGETIAGKHEEGRFGFSVELSADGSIVFISSYSNVDQGLDGCIYAYEYDKESMTWSPNGEITFSLAENSNVKNYFYFSTSANGNSIAIAAHFANGKDACTYHRDPVANNFVKMACFYNNTSDDDRRKILFTDIKVSSRGLVVAVSFTYGAMDDKIQVKVFSFNSNEWKQQGNDIQGIGEQPDGALLSLSSNGTTLAITNGNRKKIQILEYVVEKKTWEQKGQLFQFTTYSTSADSRSPLVPYLSADGSILVVSYLSQIKVFNYDEKSDFWLNGQQNVTLSHNEGDRWLPTVSSADGITIAAGFGSFVNVFRLKGTSCGDNDDIIDLIIQPDRFPQDIYWSLEQSDGRIISMGNLLDQTHSTFKYCLHDIQSDYLYFQISDRFGDGICCDWGEGELRLDWNGLTVSNQSGFESSKALVLPPSLNLKLVELVINNINCTNLSYAIINNENYVIDFRKVPPGDVYQKSLELPDFECLTFVIYDVYTSGHAIYSFLWNGEGIQNHPKDGFMEKYEIGNCFEVCSEGEDLIKIRLVTDNYPELTTWDIVSYDDAGTYLVDTYTIKNMFHYHSACLPQNECYAFHIIQFSPNFSVDELGNIYNSTMNSTEILYYEVELGNHTLFSGPHPSIANIVEFGNCSRLNCDEGLTLLNFFFILDSHPDEFSWELKNSTGFVFSRSENYTEQNKRYNFYNCIPLDQCTILELYDSGGDGGTGYSVTWNSSFIVESGGNTYHNRTINMFC